jgi:glycosyltransferase involved in cell wall biosynthesis
VTVVTSMCEGAPVVVKESLACQTPVVSVAVGDISQMVAGLPGCAVVERDPDALANAVGRARRCERHPQLRETMQVYGRQSIARRVLGVYGRLLAGGSVR